LLVGVGVVVPAQVILAVLVVVLVVFVQARVCL
jgi:hypothetical protein